MTYYQIAYSDCDVPVNDYIYSSREKAEEARLNFTANVGYYIYQLTVKE